MVQASLVVAVAVMGLLSAATSLQASPTCPNTFRADNRCGPNFGNADCDRSSIYPCCSQHGWCGNTAEHCNPNVCGAEAPTAAPTAAPVSGISATCPNAFREDKRCGPNFGNADCDRNSIYKCCSKWGWCGGTTEHCNPNVCGNVSPFIPVQTTAPTEAPTEAPTAAPTEAPTAAPTAAPVSGTSTTCPNAFREDKRCGPNFGNADCDRNSIYKCCSQWGWCGGTPQHCSPNVCGNVSPFGLVQTSAPTGAPLVGSSDTVARARCYTVGQ
jgi:hypothetical protein